jgi:hypothetical protein
MPGRCYRVWQSQVHVLDNKELLEQPEESMNRLTAFLGVPMPPMASWDKDAVESAIQRTYAAAELCRPKLEPAAESAKQQHRDSLVLDVPLQQCLYNPRECLCVRMVPAQ